MIHKEGKGPEADRSRSLLLPWQLELLLPEIKLEMSDLDKYMLLMTTVVVSSPHHKASFFFFFSSPSSLSLSQNKNKYDKF